MGALGAFLFGIAVAYHTTFCLATATHSVMIKRDFAVFYSYFERMFMKKTVIGLSNF